MATIKIDPFRVQKAGETIKTNANKMLSSLNEIKNIVNNTKSYFQSEGGDSTRKNFNESAAKFDEFKKFIDEYGQFLESYGGGQEKLDDKVASLGASIPKL